MLTFLVSLILLIAVIALAISFKWVRWLLGALALLVAIAIGYFVEQHSENQRKAEASRHLVSSAEVELFDMGMGPSYGSTYQLSGRIRNHSAEYTVTGLVLEITLQDCPSSPSCDTIGQTTQRIYSLSVPPGQVRGIAATVYFSNVPPLRGKYAWSYRIAEIEAR